MTNMIFRCMRWHKVDGGDELEPDNADHQDWECKQNTLQELALWGIAVVHHTNQEQIAEAGPLTVQRGGIEAEENWSPSLGLALLRYQSGRESLVNVRKSWYTEFRSVSLAELRVTYGLTLPVIPLHSTETLKPFRKHKILFINTTHLNGEDLIWCSTSIHLKDHLDTTLTIHWCVVATVVRSNTSPQIDVYTLLGEVIYECDASSDVLNTHSVWWVAMGQTDGIANLLVGVIVVNVTPCEPDKGRGRQWPSPNTAMHWWCRGSVTVLEFGPICISRDY